MQWREIGPATAGGRVAAVAGTAENPKLYYVGAAGGGVWKSSNSGQTWDAVFAQAARRVDRRDRDRSHRSEDRVGRNRRDESAQRRSYGDGIYKTTDGGDTWTNVGLKPTKYISRIVVDPRNHNHVVVAALGDLSTTRPIAASTSRKTAERRGSRRCSSVRRAALRISRPPRRIRTSMYTGIWQFQRRPWTFMSGGDDDGLYKSTDGGMTWTKLTGHGLPAGITGRIGLAVAPSDGRRVYALIESKDGILWRSDDGGENWTMVSKNTLVDQRPFYFSHIAVDPKNPDRVYGVSEALSVSKDGGKTFKEIADSVHVDYHAIWIAPNDPTRIIIGEDGGYALTLDQGDNWFFSATLPIAQIYRIGLGNDNPYTVCAGLQDNSAWCGPSNSLDPSGIQNKNWISTVGGDGEWSIPEPDDRESGFGPISEGGAVFIYNRVTQDGIFAQPYVQNSIESFDNRVAKYRFNWESPIAFAPWDPHVGWVGGNAIFQTTDRGRHWTTISPDLTRNVKDHQQPSGGPITHDVSSAEESDTLLDIEGSTIAKGEIWAGTDDGLVQLTRDYGKHWKNVTPPGGPEFGRYATVAPSQLVDGTAYAINDGHYVGDFEPHVFVTTDFGAHWTSIVKGLPAGQWIRAIRPDIHNKNIVYLGSEEGMFVSFDAGASWQPFQNGMPTASIHDIRMQPQTDDLLVATHGRSVYIMDDMTPVQQLMPAVASGAELFAPPLSYEWSLHSNDEGTYTNYAASNPPYGVMITFYQKEPQKDAPKLEILDRYGRVLRTVSGTHKVGGKDEPRVSNKAGLNRYTWDFQIDGPVKWTGAAKEAYQGPNEGPGVPPGMYSVRLTIGKSTFVRSFTVKPDPRSHFTQADYERSYEATKRVQAQYSLIDTMLNNLDAAKKDIDAATKAATDKSAYATVEAARVKIFNTLTANYQNDEDSIQAPGALREDVQSAYFGVQGIITQPIVEYTKRIDREVRDAVVQYNAFVTGPLVPVETALKAAKQTPSAVTTPVTAP